MTDLLAHWQLHSTRKAAPMLATLKGIGSRIELTLAGPLSASIRKNMYIEVWVALAYGALSYNGLFGGFSRFRLTVFVLRA